MGRVKTTGIIPAQCQRTCIIFRRLKVGASQFKEMGENANQVYLTGRQNHQTGELLTKTNYLWYKPTVNVRLWKIILLQS